MLHPKVLVGVHLLGLPQLASKTQNLVYLNKKDQIRNSKELMLGLLAQEPTEKMITR